MKSEDIQTMWSLSYDSILDVIDAVDPKVAWQFVKKECPTCAKDELFQKEFNTRFGIPSPVGDETFLGVATAYTSLNNAGKLKMLIDRRELEPLRRLLQTNPQLLSGNNIIKIANAFSEEDLLSLGELLYPSDSKATQRLIDLAADKEYFELMTILIQQRSKTDDMQQLKSAADNHNLEEIRAIMPYVGSLQEGDFNILTYVSQNKYYDVMRVMLEYIQLEDLVFDDMDSEMMSIIVDKYGEDDVVKFAKNTASGKASLLRYYHRKELTREIVDSVLGVDYVNAIDDITEYIAIAGVLHVYTTPELLKMIDGVLGKNEDFVGAVYETLIDRNSGYLSKLKRLGHQPTKGDILYAYDNRKPRAFNVMTKGMKYESWMSDLIETMLQDDNLSYFKILRHNVDIDQSSFVALTDLLINSGNEEFVNELFNERQSS